jgi:hypothetical protein
MALVDENDSIENCKHMKPNSRFCISFFTIYPDLSNPRFTNLLILYQFVTCTGTGMQIADKLPE